MQETLQRGVSAEADRLAALEKLPAGGLSRSVTLSRSSLLEQLTEAICDFRGEEHTLPSTVLESYLKAQQVIGALPQDIPDPEIEIDPDGEVALDWWRGARRCVSLSVSADGRLAYAGLIGHVPVHGRAPFADCIPNNVLDQIRLVVFAT